MQTLLLDTVNWDLVVDAEGNIAVASDPYSQAQDAASSIKTFQGEVYYDTLRGVPYFQNVLGQAIPVSLLKAYFVQAALLVPGTVAAICYVSSFVNRKVSGQVQIVNSLKQKSVAGF